jgi:hypothetical protein
MARNAAAAAAREQALFTDHRGADHSCQEYFFSLTGVGLERYFTEPYLSLGTGRLCRTASCPFETVDGRRFVLCLDPRTEG